MAVALGLSVAARRRTFDGVSAAWAQGSAAGSLLRRLAGGLGERTGVTRWAGHWARVGREQYVQDVALARVVLRAVMREVLAHVDVNQLAAGLDVEDVVARIDVPDLVRRILDEVDVADLIRESSTTMTTETVDNVRLQGIQADHALNQFVDRVLRRQEEQRTGLSPPTPGSTREHG